MFTVRTCWSNCLLIVVGCLTACGTSSNDLTDSRIERIDAALAQPDARDNAIDAAIVAPDAPVAFADSRIAMADAAAVAPDARIIDARIASSDAHISSPDARIPSPDARVVDASLSSPDGTLAIDATTPADAAYVPRCGNGIVDLDEQCDNGAANSNNGTCLLNCTVASCGDGFVESGVEVCDDGTNGPGTCCATDCSSHLTCSGGGINFSTGNISGSVVWNGQPITSPDLSQIYAVVFDSTTYIAYQQLSSDASYDFGSLPPGSYTLKLFSEGCFDAPDTIGQLSVTVIGQTTSTVDLDITATAGLIVGNIELNGVALPSPVLSMATCGSNGFSGDSNGNFSYYLPPASYTATVANPSQTVVGTFPVTITAGNTTDVGAEEFTTGELRGSVIWNGQPITSPDLSQIYAVVFDSTTYIAYQQLSSDASYDFGSLPPGSYTLKLFSEGCFDAPDTIGQLSVTVIGQTTSTVDLDITATAGRIVGNIELNGVALPSPTISIGTCGSNGFTGDSDGNFSYYLPPGSFTANVSNSSQTVVGSFPVTIAAGLSTEYDNAVTASGNNVSIAAAGGTSTVGGIQLIFASVTQAGTTTIIVSSEGPTAPDGLSIVGLDGAALYWAVSTTATFNGSIEVCVQYDPTQVNGPINTLNLVDVSNGFANITTSVNTSTNVICGATSTISTFAVIDQPF